MTAKTWHADRAFWLLNDGRLLADDQFPVPNEPEQGADYMTLIETDEDNVALVYSGEEHGEYYTRLITAAPEMRDLLEQMAKYDSTGPFADDVRALLARIDGKDGTR